jgi:hypothetical protein
MKPLLASEHVLPRLLLAGFENALLLASRWRLKDSAGLSQQVGRVERSETRQPPQWGIGGLYQHS